jgi:SSS family solute:Na+ symporter
MEYPIQAAIVGGYLLLVTGVGIWTKRYLSSSGDFFNSGRSLSPLLVAMVLAGAWEGSGVTVGVSQLAFEKGIYAALYSTFFALGLLILALTFARRFYRSCCVTIPEILRDLYGEKVMDAVSALQVTSLIIITGVQLLGAGYIFETLFGLGKAPSVLLAALCVVLYTTSGGLTAAAWTNLLHTAVLFIAPWIALPFVLSNVGGWESLTHSVPATHFDFRTLGTLFLLGWLITLTTETMVTQASVQAICGARDENAAVRGCILAALIVAPISLTSAVIGLGTRAMNPTLPSGQALGWMAVNVPPVVGSLLLAGILAAILSTSGPFILGSGTIFTRNIYLKRIRPGAPGREILLVSRLSTLASGVLAVFIALAASQILVWNVFAFTISTLIFFCFLVGVLWKDRVSPSAVLYSFLLSAGAIALWQLTPLYEFIGSPLPPVYAGILIFFAALLLFQALDSGRRLLEGRRHLPASKGA